MPSLQSISARAFVFSIHFCLYIFLYRQIWIEVQFISAHTYFCTGGNELKFNSFPPVHIFAWAGRIDLNSSPPMHIWIEEEIKFSSFYLFKVSKSIQRFRSYSQQQIFFYRQIWIEVQFISARTYFCTGGNELNEQYVRADINWASIQICPSVLYGRIWIEHWATGKLNSHHFTFLKFQNPSSGSEVTVNSKYYYP